MNQALGVILILLIAGSISTSILGTGLDEQDYSIYMQQEETTWKTITHQYSSNDVVFNDIAFINETHGWIVGENGTGIRGGLILHTTDGGETWDAQLYDSTQFFRQIEIIGHNIIWVPAEGGLFYTLNSGVTWNFSAIDDILSTSTISTVKFFNATYGWTSVLGMLFATVDGGQTWQYGPTWPFDDDRPRKLHFISMTNIWCLGYYGIYQTQDGGETWIKYHSKGGWTFSFVSDIEAWAVGDDMLIHMIDGQNWQEQPLPRLPSGNLADPPYFTDILFLDETHGWITGLETQVAVTLNAGVDWYQQTVSGYGIERVMAIYMINSTYGWAAGTRGIILRTTNGDSQGTPLQTETSNSMITLIIGIATIGVVVILSGSVLLRRRHRPLTLEIQ